ncbi:uncharacterized protein APUU_30435A [Aspergillus puulaauensis]|uniref:V-type ATPase n=1 Tax=Aspergillus puulaauensis TaxID=1220207 RepID=A0A7R8ALZ7_9EURO|nr:uncharacterized protein APUU_30435A [Aspergillus puulaauensis]BCS22210.1 hypothetical protein APUU_30435A [Aspergillus puulaauensis]
MSVTLAFAPRSLPARLAVRPDLQRQMLRWGKGSTCSQTRPPLRRWLGSKTSEVDVGQCLATTWLTTTPEQLTPDDILSGFPNAAPNSALEYIPVLLFTPAFAHWADTQSAFVEQCLSRFYREALGRSPETAIHAITAIIDRLPRIAQNGGSILGDETECEGVSILFARGENIQGKAVTQRQIRSTETEKPTLLFSFREEVGGSNAIRQPVHEIGLQLANTIFLNGKENTLLGTRWAYDSSSMRLKLDKSADLSTCSVTTTPTSISSSLKLPLHPVGQRRKVITSMGNILRQIAKHTDGNSNDPIPASSELEKELPRYIAENKITDQRVSVWALIETSAESPYTKSKHSQSSLASAIQTGAKLHRVMSGGGGWGKKQGLLSLDPEMSFGQSSNEGMKPLSGVLSPENRSSVYGLTSPPEPPMSMQDLSTLSQAAEPGDYVQFFASVEENGLCEEGNSIPEPSEASLTCSFGVLSDADSFLGHTVKHKTLTTIPNYFGALSEKAITYLHPMDKSGPGGILESRTKIDVPGSRVTLVLE